MGHIQHQEESHAKTCKGKISLCSRTEVTKLYFIKVHLKEKIFQPENFQSRNIAILNFGKMSYWAKSEDATRIQANTIYHIENTTHILCRFCGMRHIKSTQLMLQCLQDSFTEWPWDTIYQFWIFSKLVFHKCFIELLIFRAHQSVLLSRADFLPSQWKKKIEKGSVSMLHC